MFKISRRLFLASLCCISSATALWYGEQDINIVSELGPLLSQGAKVVLHDDVDFEKVTARWQHWAAPTFKAVVQTKTEEDIQQTILYANKHTIPFLAQSGGHGSISSLAALENGIQINLRSMNTVAISKDDRYATVGAGVEVKELIDSLWSLGKQTVTGICECVGLMGVALGGGHGMLQGHYGLLSDQILSARLVLANSTAITVSSTENKDLFWALRGAGHNYGVVASLDYRIYDIDTANGKDVWSHEVFIYPATPENVKAVYTEAQNQLETQPRGIFHYGLVLTVPALSPEPMIMHHVVWNGPLDTINPHTQAFHNLKPANVMKDEGTYLDLPRWLQTDKSSMVCNPTDFIPDVGVPRFPVDVQDYNIDALVEAVEVLKKTMKSFPEFAASVLMIEQYPMHMVREIDDKKSAFPSRKDRLLMAPAMLYQSLSNGTPNTTLDDLAIKWGTAIQTILIDGAKKQGGARTYVNYAHGGESLETMYGEEPWRLERLRRLKREYDPKNRFRFYAPIVQNEEIENEGHDEL
ncbi:FAD-binding domain-containing protein [Pleomassaria siparia CBS 279.74]|uniref:FAD-binding domain-containing protein n=1 Tax=Pleomassaria siparia CBS 279.74 TaxID=1314801 RepID=A0A6G1K8N5_9PLEO|nr:FAD-binding domain-containing protein [Pleomassaria siparia CBS 279.74]